MMYQHIFNIEIPACNHAQHNIIFKLPIGDNVDENWSYDILRWLKLKNVNILGVNATIRVMHSWKNSDEPKRRIQTLLEQSVQLAEGMTPLHEGLVSSSEIEIIINIDTATAYDHTILGCFFVEDVSK